MSLTDGAGNVAERYTYGAYGKPLFENPDNTPAASQIQGVLANPHLFAGYRFDPEVGLSQVRHRALHHGQGRWMSRDPVGSDTILSSYQYVDGSPINNTDPEGIFYAMGASKSSAPSPPCYQVEQFASQADYDRAKAIWSARKPDYPGWVPDFKATAIAKGIADSFSGRLVNDLWLHCYIGCRIAEDVSGAAAAYIAWWKENRDLNDCSPTEFDLNDSDATLVGGQHGERAYHCCWEDCARDYPNPLTPRGPHAVRRP